MDKVGCDICTDLIEQRDAVKLCKCNGVICCTCFQKINTTNQVTCGCGEMICRRDVVCPFCRQTITMEIPSRYINMAAVWNTSVKSQFFRNIINNLIGLPIQSTYSPIARHEMIYVGGRPENDIPLTLGSPIATTNGSYNSIIGQNR